MLYREAGGSAPGMNSSERRIPATRPLWSLRPCVDPTLTNAPSPRSRSSVGDVEATDVAVVIPFDAANLDGILGNPFLAHYPVTLDLRHGVFTVWRW